MNPALPPENTCPAPAGCGKARRLIERRLVPVAIGTWLVLSFYACFSSLWKLFQAGSDGAGHPFGECFINFWSAAKLAFMGHAADIYDWDIFHAFEQDTAHASLLYYHYSYSPLTPLLTMPLAWLPYVPAFILWMTATWALFWLALRRTDPPVNALFLSLAIPAFISNLAAGQNGMLTAALFGGGLVLLPKRPTLAGILFGLLCFKPQLALLIPVALVGGKYWRSCAVAAATVIIVTGLSILFYGPGIWEKYLYTTQLLRHYVLEDNTPHSWQQFISIFVSARQFGAGIAASYAIQGLCAALTAFAVFMLWKKQVAYDLRCTALVLGTFFATPYAMDYDLVITAFAVSWIARACPAYKWQVALMLIAPIVSRITGSYAEIGIGPFLLLPAFVLAFIRGWRSLRESKFA